MSFKLAPNKVYKTKSRNLGVVVFQPVGGDIQLMGTNVCKYNVTDGKRRLVKPDFDDLITITDDMMTADTVNPMTSLTEWIGFTGDDETEVWLNDGIDETVTPAEPFEEIVDPEP